MVLLRALKLSQLRQIIKDQVDNIREPLPKTLKLNKASKPKVIATLLDPKYGFQTREPKLTFEAGYGVRKHVQHARRGRASAASRRSSNGLVQAQAGMPVRPSHVNEPESRLSPLVLIAHIHLLRIDFLARWAVRHSEHYSRTVVLRPTPRHPAIQHRHPRWGTATC